MRFITCFTKSKKPACPVSNLNLNSLSDNIDNVPVKVVANTSVAFENLPFSPNTSSNLFLVSSAVTVAPALNPNPDLDRVNFVVQGLRTCDY